MTILLQSKVDKWQVLLTKNCQLSKIFLTLLLTFGCVSPVVNATRLFRKLASSCDIHPIKLRRPDSHGAWFWGRRWGFSSFLENPVPPHSASARDVLIRPWSRWFDFRLFPSHWETTELMCVVIVYILHLGILIVDNI